MATKVVNTFKLFADFNHAAAIFKQRRDAYETLKAPAVAEFEAEKARILTQWDASTAGAREVLLKAINQVSNAVGAQISNELLQNQNGLSAQLVHDDASYMRPLERAVDELASKMERAVVGSSREVWGVSHQYKAAVIEYQDAVAPHAQTRRDQTVEATQRYSDRLHDPYLAMRQAHREAQKLLLEFNIAIRETSGIHQTAELNEENPENLVWSARSPLSF